MYQWWIFHQAMFDYQRVTQGKYEPGWNKHILSGSSTGGWDGETYEQNDGNWKTRALTIGKMGKPCILAEEILAFKHMFCSEQIGCSWGLTVWMYNER
jgi:hypothetical protein